ncbi:MAG: oxygen-insensitive NADPH nitroreductase [Pseudomonadota bacterium]|nr:oxygen-insensitive NADPH nitroreductase [Pseudomonadota bacterium]
MNPTIDLLNSHRSIRRFTGQPVPQDVLTAIITAAQAAASSSFLQGVTIIRVTDSEKRVSLREVAGGQRYVEEAPEFFVFCADLSRSMRCCEQHGGEAAKGLTEQFIIATVDTALYAQNMVVAAESAGLGICYIGALRNDPARVTEILDLPQQVYPVFGMCIGWPDQDPEVKPRLPVSVMLKENSYSIDGEAEAIAAYDDEMRAYYATRSANIKIQGWSEQMAGLLGKESRLHMRPFLEGKGFLKR